MKSRGGAAGPTKTRARSAAAPTRLQQAHWQSVLDTALDAIVSIDAAGTITLFSRSAERIFGYGAKEVIGQDVGILMPDPHRSQHGDYIRRYLKTGAAQAIGRVRSLQARRKSGELFPIELSVSEGCVGRDAVFTAIVRDVSDRVVAQKTLSLLASIVQSSGDAIVAQLMDGTILSWNAGAEKIYGYRSEEVLGQSVVRLWPEDNREEFRELLAKVLAGQSVRHFETVHLSRDGWPIDVSLTLSPILDARGETSGTSMICRDVTLSRRRERHMATQFAVTRILATADSIEEASPELLQAICAGGRWQIGEFWSVDTEANLLRWTGVSRAPSIEGIEFFESVSRATSFAPGVGVPGRVWLRGEPEWVRDVVTDLDFVRLSLASKMGLHTASAFPLRSGGQINGVMMFFTQDVRPPQPDLLRMLDALGNQIGDFIERKRAEQAIRDREAQFYAFMNNSPAVAFMKDELGRYIYVNRPFERVFGKTLAELRGKNDFEIFPADTAAELHANDRRVFDANATMEVVETVPDAVGSPHNWLSFKFPISDVAGRRFLAGMAVDITDRRRAEEQLREVEKLAQQRERLADVGAITAKIVHDLGNPLGAISMQAQLILRRARRDDHQPISTVVDSAQRIVSAARRMDSLVKEFLNFAREQRLHVVPINLLRFLQDVVSLWEPVASARSVQLVLDLPPDVPAIRGDEEKLRRVIENLVKNAVEAVDDVSGRVFIRVAVPGAEKVRISVEDSGPGIPESLEVFRLFETTKEHGSGLGLPIARQIVLAHGGGISFEAAKPHGTIFHVELPIHGPVAAHQNLIG